MFYPAGAGGERQVVSVCGSYLCCLHAEHLELQDGPVLMLHWLRLDEEGRLQYFGHKRGKKKKTLLYKILRM